MFWGWLNAAFTFSLQLVVIHFLPKGENLHSKHSGFVWVYLKICMYNSIKWTKQVMSPFYCWGSWGSEKLIAAPAVTQTKKWWRPATSSDPRARALFTQLWHLPSLWIKTSLRTKQWFLTLTELALCFFKLQYKIS